MRSVFARKVDAVVISTSPPMAPLGAIAMRALRRAKVKYWVMDLNPDQIVALGMASPDALSVRGFEWLNRQILDKADDVVVLDRFMAERVNRKLDIHEKLTVLPPWPAEDPDEIVPHNENPFRQARVPGGQNRSHVQRKSRSVQSTDHDPRSCKAGSGRSASHVHVHRRWNRKGRS